MALFELSPIKQIELAAAKIPGAISLAQGIPSFNLHPEIRDFVEIQIRRGVCDRYSLTTGLQELREEICLSLAKDGMHYDPDTEIICCVGAIQALAASLMGLTSPGDEVIIPSPTYTSYQGVIAMARCVPKFAPLNEEANFDLDIAAIERAITSKTKVIFYCNPNNPTGTIFSEAATRRLMELAEKHDLTILTDEVYKDFYFVDLPHATPARERTFRKRVVRVFSFSKSFSMTGWRIGFLHSDRSVVERILPFHDAMVTCAPVISQFAAIAALRGGERIVQHYREEFRRRRDFVLSRLDRISDMVDYQIPTAAYFVFPRIKQTVPKASNSVELAYDILSKAKLALVPGSAFGPSGESHLRLSFGRDWPDLEAGCDRLESYFRQIDAKTVVSVSQSGGDSKSENVDLIKSFATLFLGWSARLYLKRNKVTVIGIVGARGKTVFKRVITEELARLGSVRGGILSYNTEIGMPLSILNISPAQGFFRRVVLMIRAILTGLFGTEEAKALVIEYGARSKRDAETLLKIRIPDYVVLTDLADIELGRYVEAAEEICRHIPPEKVFWVNTENLSEQLRLKLLPKNIVNDCPGGHYPSPSYSLAHSAAKQLSTFLRETV